MIKTSESAWIVDYCRSAFSRAHPFKTEVDAYADLPAGEMLAQLINACLERGLYPTQTVDALITGCAFPVKDQWSFGGRYAVMQSALGYHCAAHQVEQQCASGLTAVAQGAQAVLHGGSRVVLCGGAENMTRIPMGPTLFEAGVLTVPDADSVHAHHPETDMAVAMNMGLTAEALAAEYDIGRAEMDGYALRSHQRAAQAREAGYGASDVVPMKNASGAALLEQDAHLRPESTLEGLAGLRSVFREDGLISAGNSSPLTSGAALVALASDAALNAHQLAPLARIVSVAQAGVAPELMGYGVVPAVQQLLQNAKLRTNDIDLWEINEAFSVVPLVAIAQLGLDIEQVNIEGGAIAIGHPLGASGARLVGQLARSLQRAQKRYGVAALCVGGGQGVAMLIENAAFVEAH